MTQTTFGNDQQEEDQELENQDNNIIVLESQESRSERKIRERAQGLKLEEDDQEIEVL